MSLETIEVQLPADVYQSIWETTQVLNCSLGEVIAQTVKGNPPPTFTGLPEALRSEAAKLNLLDDISLWRITAESTPEFQAERLRISKGGEQSTLAQEDNTEINIQRSLTNIAVARRGIAMTILKWRGTSV